LSGLGFAGLKDLLDSIPFNIIEVLNLDDVS